MPSSLSIVEREWANRHRFFACLSLLKIVEGVGQTLITSLLLLFFFSGYVLVIFTRLICKIVLRNLLGSLIRLMDLECFELQKIKYDFSARYYSASFKLPPVFSTKVGIEFDGHGKTKSCYQTSLDKDEIITAKNSLQWLWWSQSRVSVRLKLLTFCWKLLWKQTNKELIFTLYLFALRFCLFCFVPFFFFCLCFLFRFVSLSLILWRTRSRDNAMK